MPRSMRNIPRYDCDVMVIGAGMAGMAATVFAVNRGLRVAQAGGLGGVDFTTGLLDLLGARPLAGAEEQGVTDPWAALEQLRREEPQHPYTRLNETAIRDSLEEFITFLDQAGLPYVGHARNNTAVLTAMGARKHSYRLPRSMQPGAAALAENAPCLLVDFQGLKGMSGAQVLAMQHSPRSGSAAWTALRSVTLPFPGRSGELYPEHLAWALEDDAVVQQLAMAVRPHVGDAAAVGFPAVLGLYTPPPPAASAGGQREGHDWPGGPVRHGQRHVLQGLEAALGVPVFEIPTLPPSVPGGRLRAAFETQLPARGAMMFPQKRVIGWDREPDGALRLQLVGAGEEPGKEPGEAQEAPAPAAELVILARTAILAGGRFFGRGLMADRHRVREPLFHLPVRQPASREGWHREDFFDPRGHPVNRAGLEVDACMRPLGEAGEAFLPNLFAAGAILAHQDWMREHSGAGLAIATAHAAVREVCALVRGHQAHEPGQARRPRSED
ncbi:anaerobic glycerol-3-phosphate dehydrogenase subunit B [Megalodesulfovibrio paquesii]